MRGPIDYIIIGFDGLKFDGSILKEVGNAVDSGAIELIALSVISKDEEGTITNIDIADIGDDYIVEFSQSHNLQNELIDSNDIDEVGDLLVEGSAAGILIIEHLWALPLKKALIASGGYLIADGRIHPEAAEQLNEQGE